MKRMTHKELIDYCNSADANHCIEGCPYDQKECAAFIVKTKKLPYAEDYFHPELYTDEEIVIEEGDGNE